VFSELLVCSLCGSVTENGHAQFSNIHALSDSDEIPCHMDSRSDSDEIPCISWDVVIIAVFITDCQWNLYGGVEPSSYHCVPFISE
jgi:hypothetical protein